MPKITPQTLKKDFISLLKENNISFESVSVDKDDDVYKTISVSWTKSGKICLQYSSILHDYTEAEVRALLKHELCHYVSLPSARIASVGGQDSYGLKYFLVFREYLAHREFKSRFGIDEGLRSYQKKLFMQYFDYLLSGSRYLLGVPREKQYEIVTASIFSMLYTAMYYFVFEDETFKKWCEKNDIQNFYLIFLWVYEDMKYFNGIGIDSRKREKTIQDASELFLSVDYKPLIMENKLIFSGKTLKSRSIPRELSTLWKRRLKDCGASVV